MLNSSSKSSSTSRYVHPRALSIVVVGRIDCYAVVASYVRIALWTARDELRSGMVRVEEAGCEVCDGRVVVV